MFKYLHLNLCKLLGKNTLKNYTHLRKVVFLIFTFVNLEALVSRTRSAISKYTYADQSIQGFFLQITVYKTRLTSLLIPPNRYKASAIEAYIHVSF